MSEEEPVLASSEVDGPAEPKGRPSRLPLEGEELRAALQRQVEYYFSKENLQTDWYLLSQMNSEMYVPVKTIADFRMVKNLTTDQDLLLSVIRSSTVMSLDETETMVRPTVRSIRNTLMLRDIPATTDQEEIRALFQDIKDKNNNNVEIVEIAGDASGDCWYVTFPDDEVALSAMEALKQKQFNGKPVQVRIKTEAKHSPYAVDPNANPYAYYQGVYMPYPGGNYQYWDGRGYRGYDNTRGRGYGRGRRRDFSGRGRGNFRGTNQAGKEPNGPSTRKRRGSQGANLTLGAADFPPLPSAAFEQSKTRYTDDFIKYTKQEIVDVVSAISEEKVTKPEGLPSLESIVLQRPQKDLEVSKPYPKRVTAADIVQMAPPSPKSPVAEAKQQPSFTPEKATKAAVAEKAAKSPEKAAKSPDKKLTTKDESNKSEARTGEATTSQITY